MEKSYSEAYAAAGVGTITAAAVLTKKIKKTLGKD